MLSPHLLGGHQKYIKEKISSELDKPAFLVMHGGSGSTDKEIATAVENGVIKMNIDTDTQWAGWHGVMEYYKKNEAYLQGQIGNPDGDDKPNKKHIDPRAWVHAGEKGMAARIVQAFKDLNSFEQFGM